MQATSHVMTDAPAARSGSFIELATVASLLIILSFLELEFGLFSLIAQVLIDALPWSKGYIVAIAIAIWVGMTVYSLRRRGELEREKKAHKALQEEIEIANITDSVTGLPNRVGLEAFIDRADLLAAPGTEAMLIGVYFSNLKVIFDVQGNEAGSTIATTVSEGFLRQLTPSDFIASSDGQTFYILLRDKKNLLQDRAAFFLDSLVDGYRHVQLTNGAQMPLSIHIGTLYLSICPRDKGNSFAAEAIRRTDLALHEATRLGSGSIFAFDSEMEKTVDLRARIELSLNEAITRGEIEPHFQPLIDLSQDKVVGFEVLARWNHSGIGPIPPSTFIPIAAETGRLEDITISMLDRACRAALAWPGDFKLAFNISPKTLGNKRFMADFLAALKRTGFDPNRVEVEITEDAFVEEASTLFQPINQLKQEGISISIDDFGTGYSSLHHLRIMSFDKIKIDQSFIKDLASNPESRKIVEAIIALGNSMGLLTVAEGIEGEKHRDLLEQLGCQTGQGYLFAKAMPANAVAEFMTSYGAKSDREMLAKSA